jgi:serine-type D-Ala-D-Ala carboxypeptidase (penicillin-binding protein 5/6)
MSGAPLCHSTLEREKSMPDRTNWRGRPVVAALVLWAVALLPLPVSAYETPARAAILIDLQTHQVLFTKNPDEPLPPASMSKLMTVLMVFERLKQGTLALSDTLPVSEKAWRKGGSKMFVEVGSRVSVEDLLHGIIVQSGNDACIVVAEGLAGSEEAFAEQMTERAQELGLTNTTLTNASGWPDPDHKMSVGDLARLAQILIEEYPEYYEIFGDKEYEYNGIKQHARNPLLFRDVGADGLKTGHTEEAGYGLTASAERDGRRLVMVMAGLETPGQRARESERLLEYGFRNFTSFRLFTAGEPVETADVWLGTESTVPLVPEQDVVVSLSTEGRRELEVKLVYDGPIPAPVSSGSEVAHLEISAPGLEPRVVPLVAGYGVQAAGMFGRVGSAIEYLIWGSS